MAHFTQTLENGELVLLPDAPFLLKDEEKAYLRPDCVGGAKSIKYSLSQDRMWGAAEADKDSPVLHDMLRRYTLYAQGIIRDHFPGYAEMMITGNASYRPVEAAGRVQSKRHDDRLLHVDSFPSRPVHGKRLLRVFSNINPHGSPRKWRTGEPFAKVAERFLPRIKKPLPGAATLMKTLGVTKSKRSLYDHYMLKLHDTMKLDDAYQATVAHTNIDIPAGVTWVVYSDQVSHAALGGQYMMEQTFLLPVEALHDPATAPLRVLEAKLGKPLA